MLRRKCASNINIFNINSKLHKMPTLKALIIDDNSEFRASCAQLLKSDIDIDVSDCDGNTELESLEEMNPGVVIMGLNIEDEDRLELL